MKVIDSFNFQEIQGYKFGSSLFGVPKLYSHIYYIDRMLIDTGHSRMSTDIIEKVKHLDVNQIVITHHHEDHSGNIASLQAFFDAPVYGSELCCEMMKNPPSISLSQKMSWGDRPGYQSIIPLGEIISTNKYKFQIIDIPGHARDMIALYEPDQKWLFSSDLYVNSYIGYFLKAESMSQQIASIKKVLKLDFDVLLCGHNPQLKGGKVKLEKKLNFLQKFESDVLSAYQKGKDANEIFKFLSLKEFWKVRLISNGALSKLNMVKAVIRDVESD